MAKRSARSPAGGGALALARLPPARLTPAALPFMLPTLVDAVPHGPEWVFELKWDGVRVLALRVGQRVRFWSRNGIDVTARYAELTAAVAALPRGDLALDLEVVALDDGGRSSFQLLQRRMQTTRTGGEQPIHGLVFDCLALSGRDTRSLPLRDRKSLLRELLPTGDGLRYSDHLEGDGERLFRAACAAGSEGIIAKRADSPYVGGRRREWLKIKCHLEQEFVIGGWTDPKGTRAYLGAVHLGVYENGVLVYVGRAGTGLDAARLRELHQKLRAIETKSSPFTRGSPPRGAEHHWARPELVCQVRFTEWTSDGQLRHPVYLALRDDKPPADVHRESIPPRDFVSGRASDGESAAPVDTAHGVPRPAKPARQTFRK